MRYRIKVEISVLEEGRVWDQPVQSYAKIERTVPDTASVIEALGRTLADARNDAVAGLALLAKAEEP